MGSGTEAEGLDGTVAGVEATAPPPRRASAYLWLAFPLAIGLLAFRRWDQVLHPALWVEEGWAFIPQYLEKGWLYIFEPVNGYLIVPSKLVQLAAFHVSFADLPLWTMVFTLIVSGLVAVAIATAPINVPFRLAAALVPFLVAIDPEPMAVGEYTFWFVGLLSIVALIWRSDARSHWLRYGYAAIGALSSPLGVLTVPLMIGRAVWTRKIPDIITAVAALVPAAWQVWLVASRDTLAGGSAERLSVQDTPIIIEKFVGDYFLNTDNWVSFGIGAAALLIVAGLCIWAFVSERRVTPAALFVCFGLSIGASIARVPLDGVDAFGAGPRYFLYPFIMLGWTMMSLATGPLAKRIAILLAAAAPLAQAISPAYSRTNDPVDWRSAAVACIRGDAPLHAQVERTRPAWTAVGGAWTLTGQFVEGGVNPSLGFARVRDTVGTGVSGDQATGKAEKNFAGPAQRWLSVQLLTGPDATGQRLDLLGGNPVSLDLAPLTSQLQLGWAYLLLPAPDGVTGVRLTDEGKGWGQWSAIGEISTSARGLNKGTVHQLPVHVDGKLENRRKVDLTHADCMRLSANAVLDAPLRAAAAN